MSRFDGMRASTKDAPVSEFVGRNVRRLTVAASLLATLGGCALFETGLLSGARQMFSVDDLATPPTETKALPDVRIPPNAICLDVTISERAVGDPLLGSLLWNDVEQASAVDLPILDALTKHGFRVGHTGSKPPRALETLLGLRTEFAGQADAVQNDKMLTRRMVIPAGSDRDIQTSEFYDECMVDVPLPAGIRSREYRNARCVMKITPRKLQDNWIRIEFMPEIHYGEERWRSMVVAGAWQGRTAQEIEPLYPLKFSVDLNLGEMAVVSGLPTDPESIGQHFFCVKDGENWNSQRVLIVRFSDMSRGKSMYATQ